MKFNKYELAWAAGFFDGEGCTSFASGRGPQSIDINYPRLGISQKSRIPLDRFYSAVGGVGKVYGPYQRKGTPYSYQTTSWQTTQAVLAFLWSWLSAPKREQARSVLLPFRNQPLIKPGPVRQTLCRNGHNNWYERPNQRRYCSSCKAVTRRRYDLSHRDEIYAYNRLYRARKTLLQRERRIKNHANTIGARLVVEPV